jgi:DNA-binding LytR/AlgR family response regulator
MEKTSILIVEDDMIIAANISLKLCNLGYEVTGIETKAEEAIHHALETRPDMILMDIQLKGQSNGIDAAKAIRRYLDIPIIYLTANVDDSTFQKAKETHPYAFIAKPFTNLNLERTIALVEEKVKEKREHISMEDTFVDSQEDRIFIRNQNRLVKVMFDEILFVEADRNYSKITTTTQTFLIVCPLNKLCDKVDPRHFVRIHRSFVVNFGMLDAVADSYVDIKGKLIPIGKQYKEVLHKMLNKV